MRLRQAAVCPGHVQSPPEISRVSWGLLHDVAYAECAAGFCCLGGSSLPHHPRLVERAGALRHCTTSGAGQRLPKDPSAGLIPTKSRGRGLRAPARFEPRMSREASRTFAHFAKMMWRPGCVCSFVPFLYACHTQILLLLLSLVLLLCTYICMCIYI